MTDRAAFAAHHRSLLQLEREAEVAENERLLQQCSDAELVARGATLLRLEVADLEPGFGGRLHATLRPTRGGELPQHRFGPGDVVAMRSARDDDARVVGVLVRVRRDGVVVALEDDDDLPAVVTLSTRTTAIARASSICCSASAKKTRRPPPPQPPRRGSTRRSTARSARRSRSRSRHPGWRGSTAHRAPARRPRWWSSAAKRSPPASGCSPAHLRTSRSTT